MDFIAFDNEAQFTAGVAHFCTLALKKVTQLRENLASPKTARAFIVQQQFTSDSLWGNYHKGTICRLTGKFAEMQAFYSRLLNDPGTAPWIEALQKQTAFLLSLPGK